ncbi:tRNA dihydrouridine(20/20a) synthase DusA [Oceanimonas sp. CHS3-5]|uniref:tRNA dihydrouridine(20/20a) synthase DusA n=1 Tax=Oceanimonas sp. CHS3-5 TaxID=3068186 RepID=UPI00273D7ED0|nr:tRNA dihydrouridine(20/20a) synthase DusA [Oceanimonas sp. CHS3-5]MDP5292224.1 tRNA dihydrouridine(20/20a) synthase DusA [Oceanimonas sp. CHS3-5]
MSHYPSARFSVAPMLDWTDRHCRYFHRLMSRHAQLYTEMVTTGAIIHGKGDYLAYNEEEHPLVLQLGGNDPEALAHCAVLAEQRGYDEINLNVGCPSDRVQNGLFGACLMAEPQKVAEGVAAMKAAVSIPVTVKTRIGIDEQDSYEFLCTLVDSVAEAGIDALIVHARKAWLQGLSPKENREIPTLDYDRVYQLKRDYAGLTIAVNGGIKTLEEAGAHLQHLDGVMLGREAYQNPYLLARVDAELFGDEREVPSRHQVIRNLLPYIERELTQGTYLGNITRHTLGIFQGMPGARAWRRHLSENAHKRGAGPEVVEAAMARVPEESVVYS